MSDRIKVVSVLLAITILIAALMEGFLSIKTDIIFDSPILLGLMVAAFWFAAPWIAKYIKVK